MSAKIIKVDFEKARRERLADQYKALKWEPSSKDLALRVSELIKK